MSPVANPSPNFPPNLNIRPLDLRKFAPPAAASAEAGDAPPDAGWDQHASIERFGIAGRLWEASLLLYRYLQPPPPDAPPLFDPPCSLFEARPDGRPRTALELGSGVGFSALQLSTFLPAGDLVVMTDLPEVVELMEERRDDFCARRPSKADGADVWVRPLAWSSGMELAIGDELAERRARPGQPVDAPLVDVVFCSDLVYFPALYPPLIATLLALTSPPFDPPPEVVIAYKSRDLSKEAPFWDMLAGAGFETVPVVDLASGLLLGAAEDDRMGVFVVRRRGEGAAPESTVTFEDLLFLGMGDLHDESDENDDADAE